MHQVTRLERKNPVIQKVRRLVPPRISGRQLSKSHSCKLQPIFSESRLKEEGPVDFEIFAYCSKNYEDAYNFVIDSWTKPSNVSKVTIYTDWDLKPASSKVIVKNMFESSTSWIVGTGRRLDVIKHFSDEHKNKQSNVLFLDIDCYLVRDVSSLFSNGFDIAISRLYSGSDYADLTATAGLWFTKMTPGYYNFIEDWFKEAQSLKNIRIGVQDHRISYVQYSFTKVARKLTSRYSVLPIDEKVYNSEHSDLNVWYTLIRQFNPKILHFKGRRFRDQNIIKRVFSLFGRSKYNN